MKRLICVISLALALASCSTISNVVGVVTGTTVTPNQAYIAANAFDALEATATTYLKLPACVSGGSAVCRTQSAVNAIVPAIRVGRKARNNLLAAVTAANGSPVSASLYATLTGQASTLQQIMTSYNIGANQ